MKIVSIVGARPQFVKAGVVSRALRDVGCAELLVHTGQHYDDNMSAVFFRQLRLPEPSHNLGIGSLPHGAQTGRMLEAVEGVLAAERPDAVLVYGDTNSTLAGALAAAKLHIRVAHVEAGLRSCNRTMPEEINRVVADHVSDLLFVPTEAAVANLRREGVADAKIRVVGDVMYDAALEFGDPKVAGDEVLGKLAVARKQYVLATVHRAENTDDPARLAGIIGALEDVAATIPVVLPLHPRTRAKLGRPRTNARLMLTEPVGYLDMLALERGARVIATDSGGVQKEAFFFRVPCVTIRTETEWRELVECGWNMLADPADRGRIAATIMEAAERPPPREPVVELYGGGRAAQRIAEQLRDWR